MKQLLISSHLVDMPFERVTHRESYPRIANCLGKCPANKAKTNVNADSLMASYKSLSETIKHGSNELCEALKQFGNDRDPTPWAFCRTFVAQLLKITF